MKKKRCVLLALLLSLALYGCGRQQASASVLLNQALSAVLESQTDLPALTQLTPNDADFTAFLSGDYGIDPAGVSDGIIAYADGVEASEIILLTLTHEGDASAVQTALMAYAQERAGLFDGYAPVQAAMARNAKTTVSGKTVALLICPDAEAAEQALLGSLGEEAVSDVEQAATGASAPTEDPVAESTHDGFQATAILEAWHTGDTSALSDVGLQILNAAKDVIARETTDTMSDYEKELAIHDWLTHWSSFDMSAFSRNPGSDGGTDSDTPYGVLIGRSGNCWGYASTFQLLMNMLDIECITVYGMPRSSGVEHAWNMVRLDGEWYCVDAAWDDPIGGSPNHQYFNATSEDFRHSGIHSWDESSYPEATGTVYRYR